MQLQLPLFDLHHYKCWYMTLSLRAASTTLNDSRSGIRIYLGRCMYVCVYLILFIERFERQIRFIPLYFAFLSFSIVIIHSHCHYYSICIILLFIYLFISWLDFIFHMTVIVIVIVIVILRFWIKFRQWVEKNTINIKLPTISHFS